MQYHSFRLLGHQQIILIVLLMSEGNAKPHKKNQGNHDGCADCIRQKKENQAFIGIYQRLQQVEKRTTRVRQAVSQHKNHSDTNRSFYRTYEERVVNLPKMKDRDISMQAMQSAGYQIAAGILQKESKSKIIDQNKKLKEILTKMQKEKYASSSPNNQRQLSGDPYPRLRQSLGQTFNSEINSSESVYLHRESPYCRGDQGRRESLQKMASSQQTSDSCQQNSSTQSSSFNMCRMRNSMDLGKYNDLNLWLYQNQKNAKLEEELYIVKQLKPKSYVHKRNGSLLPSIKK